MADLEQQQQRESQLEYLYTKRWASNSRMDADDTVIPEHPNLHLSPEEKRLFGQLFNAADADKIGVVTGEVAVKFFEKTRLPPDILGEVG